MGFRNPLAALPIWMAPVAALVGVGFLGAAAVFVLLDDEGGAPALHPTPTVRPGTPTPTTTTEPAASNCPVDAAICEFAAQLQAILPDWKEMVVRAAAGSNYDHGDGYSEVLGAARAAGVANTAAPTDGGNGSRLVAIGCPVNTGAIPPCSDGFALSFSTLPLGIDPGPGETGIFVLIYSLETGSPVLSGYRAVTEHDSRRVAVNGGHTQECDAAGNPPGSINPHCASADYIPYPVQPEPPAIINGVPVTEFELRAPVALPRGVYYFITGCWGCDGGGEAIWRAYFDGTTQPQPELISPDPALARSPDGVAISEDGSRIAAVICDPYCSGLGAPDPGTRSTIYLSTDGGVTWVVLDEVPGLAWLSGFAGDEVRAMWVHGDGPPETWEWDRYFDFPSRTFAGDREHALPRGTTALADGIQVVGRPDGSALLNLDGSVFWEPDLYPPPYNDGGRVWAQPGTDLRFATWAHVPGDPSMSEGYVAVYRREALERVIRVGTNGPGGHVSTWTDEGQGPGSALLTPRQLGWGGGAGADYARPVPALIDYLAGSIAPIEPEFVRENFGDGRVSLVVSLAGTFLRVNTPGECLRVRQEPSLDATVVECVADNVLLARRSEVSERDGITWLSVEIPAGQPGWASAEFLEP